MSIPSVSRYAIGLICAMCGAVLFSSKAIFIKFGYAIHADPLDLLFLRVLFAVPIFLAISLTSTKNAKTRLTKTQIGQVILLGFLGYYLASVCDFYGLTYIAANLERLILYLYPTLVLIFGRLFFKESITKQQGLSICITYLGIGMIVGIETNSAASPNPLKGALFVGMSALFYAAYIVFSGRIIPHIGPTRFTAMVMLAATSFISIHYGLVNGFYLPTFDMTVYGLCLSLAIICTIIPTLLLSQAIHRIGSSHTALVGNVGPASTIILAHLCLGESLSTLQLLGVGVVMLGIYALTIPQSTSAS